MNETAMKRKLRRIQNLEAQVAPLQADISRLKAQVQAELLAIEASFQWGSLAAVYYEGHTRTYFPAAEVEKYAAKHPEFEKMRAESQTRSYIAFRAIPNGR